MNLLHTDMSQCLRRGYLGQEENPILTGPFLLLQISHGGPGV